MRNIEETVTALKSGAAAHRALLKSIYGFNGDEHIIFMNGGLGNQMFQYFFYKWLSREIKAPVIVDDTYFFVEKKHNGLELENIFGFKLVKLSDVLPKDVFSDMLERRAAGEAVPEQLYQAGYPISVIGEFNAPEFSGAITWQPGFYPVCARNKGMLYYHMYNLDARYLKILAENGDFSGKIFPDGLDEKNLNYAKAIKSTESVALHIRRGDFVTLGWAMDIAAYNQAISVMNNHVQNPVYFIFSDDLDYCREHLAELGLENNETVFVEGNVAPNNYRDLQLMIMCKHRIVNNSSFCYLAALLREGDGLVLNMNPSREVI